MPIEKSVQISEPPPHKKYHNTCPKKELRHNEILRHRRDAFTADVDRKRHPVGVNHRIVIRNGICQNALRRAPTCCSNALQPGNVYVGAGGIPFSPGNPSGLRPRRTDGCASAAHRVREDDSRESPVSEWELGSAITSPWGQPVSPRATHRPHGDHQTSELHLRRVIAAVVIPA